MARKAIVKIVQRYLHTLQEAGIPVLAGVLYGSHARGKSHRDSDIDLLVICGDAVHRRANGSAIDLAWQLRLGVDWRIEPVLVSQRRWKHDDGSPLLATIRQEGLIIRPQLAAPMRNVLVRNAR